MRVLFVVLLLALALNIAAAFANLAAVLQRAGSDLADPVGFGGIAFAFVAWVAGSVWVCRNT